MLKGPESFGGSPKPMDAENLTRIDDKINREIGESLHTVLQARGDEANKDAIKAAQKEQEKNFNVSPAAVLEKLKNNPAAKKVIGYAALGAAVGIFATSFILMSASKASASNNSVITNAPKAMVEQAMTPAMTPVATPEAVTVTFENDGNEFAGETINGVKYDYTEYADRENKVAYNAYGYDYTKDYNDRNAATNSIIRMAEQEPEALASYAYNAFTDDEKQELGIKGLSMVEIDNKFDQAGGGDLQKSVLSKFSQILKDDKTSFNFYRENDTEQTNYVYFVDENEDGNYTPDELHLGYDTKRRSNAPQVDISRTITNPDGTTKTIKVLDLNMNCGYQPNYEKAPQGVPKIESNKPVPQVISGGGPGGGGGGEDPTPPPDPDPKPVPPDPVPPDPDPKPTPKPKPKNPENLERIDDKVHKDIGKDDHTGRVNPEYNPGVSPEDITAPPSPGDYGGTAPVTTPNQPSQGAEDVQPTNPGNDYGGDQGGANDGNANENPVEGNDQSQEEADRNEQTDLPSDSGESGDELADLGIR